MKKLPTLLCILALSLAQMGMAQEDAIRKSLAENLPKLPKIDEISKSPIPGVFEVRVGTDIYYSDATGKYLIDGRVIDTVSGKNLTEERINKLTAVSFKDLPIKDAFVIKRGTGDRKIAVFEDPNCGYCKRFEADLQKVNNVTIYMFLYPILGADSSEKSKNIWCAKDKVKAWQDWMLVDTAPAKSACPTDALLRNVEFGKKHRITGTPTILFTDGSRIPGAINSVQLEQKLQEIKVN